MLVSSKTSADRLGERGDEEETASERVGASSSSLPHDDWFNLELQMTPYHNHILMQHNYAFVLLAVASSAEAIGGCGEEEACERGDARR
ncbi:hypothetical protein EYF80_056820 [Liparis tanakae]|uniref:Uncharacterized protein n=1 Tax=Liparis tanakae TaxID=230148 RepID=A0A4Z2EW38_9TELE|nr:hypothetical protein EYF80_056820 [Liparis tanakae]